MATIVLEQITEKDKHRFWSNVDQRGPDECWLWTAFTDAKGYGPFKVGRGQSKAHRISWMLANGEIQQGLCVCHNCPAGDNPSCVNPAHLWLGTNAENIADRDTKGRQFSLRGTACNLTKLTEASVVEIRRLCATGISQYVVAAQFNITQAGISLIVLRKTWKHVP